MVYLKLNDGASAHSVQAARGYLRPTNFQTGGHIVQHRKGRQRKGPRLYKAPQACTSVTSAALAAHLSPKIWQISCSSILAECLHTARLC